VSTWRDSASQQAQDDLEDLLNDALPFAKQMLAKHGEFVPYGVVLPVDGESETVAGWTGDEQASSSDVLALLLDGVKQRAADLRAAALVADVRTADGEAIRVELEHREGPVMVVLLAYKRRRFGRGIEYGELTAGVAERRIW
jgi:hypothetical protein